jgi:hypothetical protein
MIRDLEQGIPCLDCMVTQPVDSRVSYRVNTELSVPCKDREMINQ